VVPIAERPQPLCARWSRAALASVDSFVASGERSMGRLLDGPDVVLVPTHEWSAAGKAGSHALDDVDTPAELDLLKIALRPHDY